MDKTLSQMVAVQMFHHSLLFFSSVWCLHLSITDEIAMNPFKCIDSIMCLFHNFVTLIVKRFACLFDCIQQVLNVLSHDEQGTSNSMWTSLLC